MRESERSMSSSIKYLLPFQLPRSLDDDELDYCYSDCEPSVQEDEMLELYRQAVPLVQPQSTAAVKTLGKMVRNRELVKRMLQRPQPFAEELDRRPHVYSSLVASKSASTLPLPPTLQLSPSNNHGSSQRHLSFMAACEKLMVAFDPQVQHTRQIKLVQVKPLLRFHGLEVNDVAFRRWEQRLSVSTPAEPAAPAGPMVSVSEFIQGCQHWFTETFIIEQARDLSTWQNQQHALKASTWKNRKLLPLQYEPQESPAQVRQAPFDQLTHESDVASTFSYKHYARHPAPQVPSLASSASAPALLHAKYCSHNKPDPITLATIAKLKHTKVKQRRAKKEAETRSRRTRMQNMEIARAFSASVAMISRHVHNEEMRDQRESELEATFARADQTRQWNHLHEAHCIAIEQDSRAQRAREVRAMKMLAEEELRFARDFRAMREEVVRRNKTQFTLSSSTSTIFPPPPEILAARATATTPADHRSLARVEREHTEHMRSLQLLDYAYDRKRMLDDANQPRADSALVEVDVADNELPADRVVQLAGDELWRQIVQQQELGDPESLAIFVPPSNSPPAALRFFGINRPVSLPAFASNVDRGL